MRNLNFLRKSERKSVGTTLALTVGSPSAHRRYSALKHLAFMLLFLLGSLNVWADEVTWSFKTLQVTSGTQNGISWVTGKTGSASATICNSTNGLVLYYNNGGGYFNTSSATSGAITHVNIVSTAKKNTPKYTIYGSANGTDWTEIENNIGAGTKDSDISGSYTYLKIANTTGSAAQLGVTSITITYSGSGNPTPSLDHIAITGTPSKTYEQGQSFDPTGLTVTAYYDDDTNADVTGYVEWSFNPATFTVAGENKSVTATATYQEKEASETYNDITVTEHVVTPGEYDISLNNVLYGTAAGANITVSSVSATKNDITIVTGATSGTKPYTGADAIRYYQNNYLTLSVPSGYQITAIEFAEPSSGKTWNGSITVNTGTYTNSTKSWEGKANSVTFSFAQQNRIATATVTYEAIAPEVTVDPSSLSFEAKQNIAVAGKTFTLTGANLTSGLTLAASAGFNVSPESITAADAMAQGGVEVTVTPATPTTTTTPVEGTVTISGGGLASNVVVNLSMAVTPTYAVEVAVNDNAKGSATINGGAGPVYAEYAEEVTLVASANPGYEFVEWTVSDNDIVLGDENAASTTAMAGAAGTITANFQAQACSLLDAPVLDGTIATTYNSATINWAAVANADGYNVEVKLGDVVKGSDLILEAPLSYTVNNLEANTTYNYTIQTVGDGTTYCEESGVLAGSFTTADYPSVAVTYSENGNEVSGGSKQIMNAFALPTEVTNNISGKTFVGWTTKSDFTNGNESDEETYFAKGADFTITSNADVTLYAVYATVVDGAWTKVEIGSITENDVIVVAGVQDGSNYYGLSSANGTSSSPSAVALTVSNNTITAGVTDAVKWNLKGTAGNYILYANGTANYLYNTAATTSTSGSNSAWRVGQPTEGTIRKLLKENSTTLSTNEASNPRFLCQYNNSDWRGYVNNTSTNAKTTIAFFKAAVSYSDYVISGSVALPVLDAPKGLTAGTYYEAQTITLAATNDAAIYYSLDGNDPTVDAQHLYSEPFTLSEHDVVTVKAIAVKSGYENSPVATAEYNINLPYDFADFAALEKVNNKEYAVRGIISQIDDVQSGKLTYYISANGATEGQLKLYKGLGLEKATFSAVTDVNLGDNVTVVGTWSTQHSNLNQDNWMLEYTARVHDSYEIVGDLTTTGFQVGEAFDDAILGNLSVKEVFTNGYEEAVAGATFNCGDKTEWLENETSLTVYAKLGDDDLTLKNFDVTVSSATLVSFVLKEGYKTEYYVGDEFVKPTVKATLTDNTHPEAEATACTGYDMSAAGNYTVNVAFTYGDITIDEGVTYQITVKAVFDNEDAPHTVAKAIELIEASAYQAKQSSTDYMWVSGKVSGFNGTSNKNYYISDDGTATGQLYVYSGSYFGGVAFTDANKLHVGDEVILKATILNYNGSTAELTNSQVVYQLRAGALTVADVAALEIGQELAEADLTINRNGSNGAITFSCDENDALEIVENGTKLRAKGEATADVTVTATMAAVETQGVINYTAASTTFTVHVIPAQTRYAVTFNLDEGSADPTPSLGNQLENANVVIPAGTYTKDGYKFNGWSVKETVSENPVEVTETAGVYSFTMPAAAVTVTAQWVEGMDASWVAATWASANKIKSNTDLKDDYATIAVDANISMTWDKATGSNVPAYNSGASDARLYLNTTLQFNASNSKLIKHIAFTFTTNYAGALSANNGTYENAEWTGLAQSVTFTNTISTQARIKSIDVEYINGTVTTLSIAPIALKTSDEEATAISPVCNVTPTPTITYSGYDTDLITIENGTVAHKGVIGNTTVTATIAQGSNYLAATTTFTVTVSELTMPEMSFPQASYNAKLGKDFAEPVLTTDPAALDVTYSSSVETVATVNENTGEILLVGEGQTVITASFAGNDNYSPNTATYTLNVIDPTKDVLTAEAIEAGSSYVDWSEKTFSSDVKYAGNSKNGDNPDHAGAIQMRSSTGTQAKSGIVTTSAIGYLSSISATQTTNGNNYLEIYAKGSQYESVSDLYSSDELIKGVKIGTIGKEGGAMVFETGEAYSKNYKYIGIKSNNGAVYYDAITIIWTPAEFASYNVTYKPGEGTGENVVESIEEGSLISLKAADTFEAPEGKMFAGWLLEGEENAREAGSKFTVTEAATFVAQWINIYTITYLPGEAAGDPVVVENVPVGNYSLAAANTFEAPASKEFAGWKLNNEGEALEAGSNYNVTGNASFTAQWSIIKQPAGLAYATTSYMITRGRSFEAPELTNPYSLAVEYSGNNDEVATVDAATGAITLKGVVGEVTVTATSAETDYYYAGEASYTLKVKDANLSGGWVRLTNANTLVAGMKVIVAQYVSSQNGTIKTMGGQNANNRAEVAGSLEDGTLVADEGTEILTLVAIKNTTNFALKTADNKYLFAAGSGSGKNYLKSQANVDGNATWAISLSADGKATITAQGDNTNKIIRYNNNNKLFSCYSSSQQDIALYSKTVAVSEGDMDASTLEEYADVVVADGATLVINEGTKPLGNITGNVEVNAPLQAEGVHLGVNNTMEVNSTVNVPSFSISVKLGSTGQATNVNVTGSGSIAAPEGYVDMELADGANPDHWHSFTVPFEVDAINGIYDAETGAKLQNEVNYAIMDYHGDIRANGDYGWKKYRGILQPGVFYLITIDGESKVLRFMKKEGSNYIAENNMEMTYYDGAGASTDFGWCGVGNQNMFNGYVPQTYVAQVLNAAGTGYEAIDNTQAMSACIPFFIQVNVTVNLIMNTSAPSLAPRRMPAKGVERMKVFFGNENYTDKLYISASEEATNEYEIGKDLLKMTMTNTPSVPQIFGKAYGNKLCMIDAPMVNDQATYGLTLYAPAAGEYTISAPAMDNADLYLTLNGAIIWNLSMGEYTNDFAKGNNEGYGLLLVKKAPQVTTGVENAEANETGVQKVIINEHVYILRAEQMYDVTGKLVK